MNKKEFFAGIDKLLTDQFNKGAIVFADSIIAALNGTDVKTYSVDEIRDFIQEARSKIK